MGFLVLQRRVDEFAELDLGDGRIVRVAVLGVGSRGVRIGFDAPESVTIRRSGIDGLPARLPPAPARAERLTESRRRV